MKKTFFSVAILATLLLCVQNTNAQKLKGVEINGVIWATTNAGAKVPEDYGKYYTWEKAQTACPKSWRVPTREEFRSLEDAGSVWTVQNGKGGLNFGDGNNTIFMPAAGHRNIIDDTLEAAGLGGCYWSSTNINHKCALHFNSSGSHICGGREVKFSVRCVKK